MISLSERYSIAVATEDDDPFLRAIYESDAFEGGIGVQYLRGQNPLTSLAKDGERAIVLLLRDDKENCVVGMGACVIRRETHGGSTVRTAYLTGLKILPTYRKRMPHIPQIYRILHDLTEGDVDRYTTTILEANTAAQKLLEKPRASMPRYTFRGVYTVHCFAPVRPRLPQGCRLLRGLTDEVRAFYAETLFQCDGAPDHIDLPGLASGDFFALEQGGRIRAACAIWDQRAWKPYRISQYGGLYRAASHLPLRAFGYPNLPKPGSFVDYASVALLRSENGDPAWARAVVDSATAARTEFGVFLLGFHESNPLNALFERRKSFPYRSRLYDVSWGEPFPAPDRPIGLEVGLL